MRQKMLMFVMVFVIALLAACGNSNDNNNNNNNENNNDNNEVVNNENENNNENNNDNDNEEVNAKPGEIDFDRMVQQVEEKTDGEANIVYETTDSQSHEEDEYTVSLDGYIFAEIEDYHQDHATPFGDEDESGFIITHLTFENTHDEAIAYNPLVGITYSGANRYPGLNTSLIEADDQLHQKIKDKDYMIEPGEVVSGYFLFTMHPEDIEGISSIGQAAFDVPEAGESYDSDNYQYENKIGRRTEFTIVIDEDGAARSEEQGSFYKDSTITDNMGDKTMIKEKTDIGETESLGKSEVTLDGYKFTEFEPNEVEAPRFENFDEGVVLLTVRFLVENGEDEDLSQEGKAKLTLNDGKQYTLHELFLSPYTNQDVIKQGDEGEMLVVFVLDKEQYDKVWKDKSFEVEFGPLNGVDTIDISKGKTVEFDLPE